MDYITQKKIELGCDTEKISSLERQLRRKVKLADLELWVAMALAEDRKLFLEAFFFRYPCTWWEEADLWRQVFCLAAPTGYRSYCSYGKKWNVKKYDYKECKAYRIEARKRFFDE